MAGEVRVTAWQRRTRGGSLLLPLCHPLKSSTACSPPAHTCVCVCVQIRGYPTLKVYHAGAEVDSYKGEWGATPSALLATGGSFVFGAAPPASWAWVRPGIGCWAAQGAGCNVGMAGQERRSTAVLLASSSWALGQH